MKLKLMVFFVIGVCFSFKSVEGARHEVLAFDNSQVFVVFYTGNVSNHTEPEYKLKVKAANRWFVMSFKGPNAATNASAVANDIKNAKMVKFEFDTQIQNNEYKITDVFPYLKNEH